MLVATLNNSASTGFVNTWVIVGLLLAASISFLVFIWKRRVIQALLSASIFMFLVNVTIGAFANWDVTKSGSHGWSSLPGWVFYAPIYAGLVLLVTATSSALLEHWGLQVWRRPDTMEKFMKDDLKKVS
jgi:hypothetical protein